MWLLQPGGKAPTAVDLPFDGKQQVTMLRVAPDGVRVAMIVRGPDGSHVMVGAITRSGSAASIGSPVQVGAKVAHPGAVSWYDADNLAVLVGAGTAAAQIHKVPVNGGQPTEIAPDANAISLTVGGGQIVVGELQRADGHLRGQHRQLAAAAVRPGPGLPGLGHGEPLPALGTHRITICSLFMTAGLLHSRGTGLASCHGTRPGPWLRQAGCP